MTRKRPALVTCCGHSNEYGPCLILIDEWVAYARQLHDQSDLPAGGFETQFTFAQALTESAKLAKNCLLVISLPASDTAGSPHTQADDVEVGGQRGREALDRLRNVVGRVESSWRPANLLIGSRSVAGDQISHAAVRNMMCCTVTGQGAGIAAAVSVKNRVSTAEVKITDIQAELKRQGVRFS
jgi:hypothetical protein